MESFKDRLRRFLFNEVYEIPGTLLNSISNYVLPPIQRAGSHNLEYPVFLGTHAIMQTISEKIFGLRGPSGTQFYLQNFVDGGSLDRTYSSISAEIHEMRNVVAHQWMSSMGHTVAIDYRLSGGLHRHGKDIHINPRIYLDDFAAGFGGGGRIWNYE